MTNNILFIFFCLVMGSGMLLNAQEYSGQSLNPLNPSDSIQEKAQERLNPWQQNKNEYLLSPYISHYVATAFRDINGNKSDFSENGKYSNFNPRLYIAAPLLSDKINITASLPYFFNQYENDNTTNKNSDLGDVEIGFRFHLAKIKDQYLMASLISYIPIYKNNVTPYAGYDLFGLESRFTLAGTLKFLGNYNNFHKIEIGLRYFFPEDPSQLRFLISEGYRLQPKLILLGEIEGMLSFSDNEEFVQSNLQSIAEYKMIKASLNVGYEFTNSFALYTGVFHDIFNRNAAIGRGFQLFTVINIK